MKRAAIAAFLSLVLVPGAFAQSKDVKRLIARWGDYNEQCRGGSGDDPKTHKACEQREAIDTALAELGYCWKGKWRKC